MPHTPVRAKSRTARPPGDQTPRCSTLRHEDPLAATAQPAQNHALSRCICRDNPGTESAAVTPEKQPTDISRLVRWSVWVAFLLFWSTALLVPNPLAPFNQYVLGGQELPEDTSFLMAKSLHVAAYATAAILTGWLGVGSSWRWWLLAFWFVHAGATEWGQTFVPPRTGSLRDVALNLCGLIIGWALSRRWSRRGHERGLGARADPVPLVPFGGDRERANVTEGVAPQSKANLDYQATERGNEWLSTPNR
jgi:VanZ family protein